jgi:integrase
LSATNSYRDLQAALTQFAQCISVLAGDDRTRHEVMVEESRPILKGLQRAPIGRLLAAGLHRKDVIEHCRRRQAAGVLPQTVNQDITYLSVALKYAGSNPEWNMEDVTHAAVEAAKPYLRAHTLIGNSKPRTQRPTPAQLAALSAYFAKQNRLKRVKTDMVKVLRWQNASAMRIGSTCSIRWLGWSPWDMTMFVPRMKSHKAGRMVALTNEAQAMLFDLAHEMNEKPELRTAEERIFPYSSKTCSARHTLAKHALEAEHPGIDGIRMHDNRRDRTSRLIEDDGYTPKEATAFTGHTTDQQINRTYAVLDVSKIARLGPAARRIANMGAMQ